MTTDIAEGQAQIAPATVQVPAHAPAPTGPKIKVFHKGVILEWVLIGIIAAEILYFLWLFIHPSLFHKAPIVPAGAPQVISSNPDQPAGGGIAMPGGPGQGDAPKPGAPAASSSKDDKGHEAAAKGEDLHLYLTIDNAGAATSLAGASSSKASASSFWQVALAGAAPEASAKGLPIAAKGVTTLDDEHAWVALNGLTDDFKKGDKVDVTLTFEGQDPVTLSVPIYRTSDTAAENPEPAIVAGDLSISAFWAEPFAPGE